MSEMSTVSGDDLEWWIHEDPPLESSSSNLFTLMMMKDLSPLSTKSVPWEFLGLQDVLDQVLNESPSSP